MRRSGKILAGAVIATLLVGWLLRDRQAEDRPSPASRKAHFLGSGRVPTGPRLESTRSERQSHAEPIPPGGRDSRFPPSQAQRRGPSDESLPARLELVVLDSATRQPVRDVQVTAVNRATGDTVSKQQLPEGRGTIQLPTAALRLSIEHPDYRARGLWLEFTSGIQTSRQVIELIRELRLTGTVRDQNGRAVSGATVRLPGSSRSDPPVITGLDGKFEFKTTPGSLQGFVVKGADTAGFEADITPSTRTLNLTLPISSPSVTFSGRVLNEKSEPAEGARIIVRTLAQTGQPLPAHDTAVQQDGTFVLSIAPAVVVVAIRLEGYRAIDETIAMNSDVHRDYSLKPYQSFSVTLLTPEGTVLKKGFRVVGVGTSISKLSTFPDGRCTATEYPIEIQATATELGYGNSEVVRLASYEPEVVLKIEPGGIVRGRVVDPSGAPIRRFSYLLLQGQRLYLSQSLLDSADGAFCVRHVAPGRYTLKVIASGGEQQREVVVDISRECLVEVVMETAS